MSEHIEPILWTKIETLLSFLSKREHYIEQFNFIVKNNSRKELLTLINIGREELGQPLETYGNLKNKLNSPSFKFKNMLNFIFGLDELGFSADLWDKSASEIVRSVKYSLDGGPISIACKMRQNKELITLSSSKEFGFASNDPINRISSLFKVPGIVVKSSKQLHVTIAMPFSGYIRVIAFEDGEFFGLNEELDLTCERLLPGEYPSLNLLKLSRTVPRSIVFAAACEFNVFENWPRSTELSEYKQSHEMTKLFGEYIEVNESIRSQKVTSFVTSSE